MDLALAGKVVIVTGATANFTQVLAKEVAQHGIAVNAVAPYGTFSTDPAAYGKGSRFHPDSDFVARVMASSTEYDNKMRRRTVPGPREFAKAEEIAAAALYLASPRAEFVTGQILSVNGGGCSRFRCAPQRDAGAHRHRH